MLLASKTLFIIFINTVLFDFIKSFKDFSFNENAKLSRSFKKCFNLKFKKIYKLSIDKEDVDFSNNIFADKDNIIVDKINHKNILKEFVKTYKGDSYIKFTFYFNNLFSINSRSRNYLSNYSFYYFTNGKISIKYDNNGDYYEKNNIFHIYLKSVSIYFCHLSNMPFSKSSKIINIYVKKYCRKYSNSDPNNINHYIGLIFMNIRNILTTNSSIKNKNNYIKYFKAISSRT